MGAVAFKPCAGAMQRLEGLTDDSRLQQTKLSCLHVFALSTMSMSLRSWQA